MQTKCLLLLFSIDLGNYIVFEWPNVRLLLFCYYSSRNSFYSKIQMCVPTCLSSLLQSVHKQQLRRKFLYLLIMSKRKLNVLSLRDKLKVVNAFESGKLRYQIQSEFNLSEPIYYKIIKSKKLIKCSEGHGNIKRSRLSVFPDVEKCLLEWIKQTLDKNIPIGEPLLKQTSIDT